MQAPRHKLAEQYTRGRAILISFKHNDQGSETMLKSLLTQDEYKALGADSPITEHYEKSGDNYVLKTDDSSFQTKIKEFRNNNIRLSQEIESVKKEADKYAGLDPEKARAALDKLQELEDKNKIDAGKIDEVVEQRVAKLREDLEGKTDAALKRVADLEKANGQLNAALESTLIDSDVATSVNKIGTVRSNALGFITSEAKKTWKLRDMKSVPLQMGDDGKEVIVYGKDAKMPLTMDEWAINFAKKNPWAFESTKGAGGGDDNQPHHQQTGNTIASDDRKAFSDNIADIASGKVTVAPAGGQ